MRYKIDRLVLKILILIMLTSSFPLTVLADVKDQGNEGDATGGSKSGRGLVWMDTFAGYRFAIVDQNFKGEICYEQENNSDFSFSSNAVQCSKCFRFIF